MVILLISLIPLHLVMSENINKIQLLITNYF